MKVQKLKKIVLSDQVYEALRQEVFDGIYPKGKKIPSESELAEAFGVNRLTIRIALQKLNTLGILETRAGEGTFVKEFDFSEYLSEVSDLFLRSDMLPDVCAFRRLLELECIRLAVFHYDEEEIKTLQKTWLRFASHIRRENVDKLDLFIDDYVSMDLEFHQQVCRMSKNSIYLIVYNAVMPLISEYCKEVFIQDWKEIHAEDRFSKDGSLILERDSHFIIIEAIKNRDAKLAAKYYENMIVQNVFKKPSF
ncbi:MAG: GntR family transcriptional regulator [Treponema sp.]|nr:GntR family transcriptional regulator [Treponema sp.]